jgi:hypothetical protein
LLKLCVPLNTSALSLDANDSLVTAEMEAAGSCFGEGIEVRDQCVLLCPPQRMVSTLVLLRDEEEAVLAAWESTLYQGRTERHAVK